MLRYNIMIEALFSINNTGKFMSAITILLPPKPWSGNCSLMN